MRHEACFRAIDRNVKILARWSAGSYEGQSVESSDRTRVEELSEATTAQRIEFCFPVGATVDAGEDVQQQLEE